MRKSVKVYLWALVVSILPTIALFAYMLLCPKPDFTNPDNLEQILNMDLPETYTNDCLTYEPASGDDDWIQTIIFKTPLSNTGMRMVYNKGRLGTILYKVLDRKLGIDVGILFPLPHWDTEYDGVLDKPNRFYVHPFCLIEGHFTSAYCRVDKGGATITYSIVAAIIFYIFYVLLPYIVIFLIWGIALLGIKVYKKYRYLI